MTHRAGTWNLEKAWHLDAASADLDSLREAVAFLEWGRAEAMAGGVPDEAEDFDRPLARLTLALAARERRLL